MSYTLERVRKNSWNDRGEYESTGIVISRHRKLSRAIRAMLAHNIDSLETARIHNNCGDQLDDNGLTFTDRKKGSSFCAEFVKLYQDEQYRLAKPY